MIRVGIVAALPVEGKILARTLPATREVLALPDGALLLLSGIGARRARAAADRLFASGATALVSWGVAAALARHVPPGSLLLPMRLIAADGTAPPIDVRWRQRLHDRLAPRFAVHAGALAEADAVLTDSGQKRALFERCGAIAADMESAALGSAAAEAGVPFVVVRAVSDGVDLTLPQAILSAMDGDGRIRPRQLVGGLFARPREALGFLRLGLGFRAARATLAGVARSVGTGLLAAA